MHIHQSGEDYLETILILQQKKGSVRSVDIVEELGYSKSSVSRAVNILKDKGYIVIDPSGLITFTEKGFSYSRNVYERHKILTGIFIDIGVSEKVAEEDACKIEHVLSEETFLALKNLSKNKK